MEAGGDNKLWIIKPTELSNISYNPMYRRGYIGQHVNFSIQDIQDSSVWSDLDLEFHGCIVQHFGYNGKIDILKKYVETIWGINSKAIEWNQTFQIRSFISRFEIFKQLICIISI